jgi:hypothetical protein
MLRGADPVDLRSTSRFEEHAIITVAKLERLGSERIRRLISKAAQIEPLIHEPQRARVVAYPPFAHQLMRTRDVAEAVRRELPVSHVDSVVLVPQTGTADPARAAIGVAHTLRQLDPGSSVLVIATDDSGSEATDRLPDDVAVLDLNARTAGLRDPARTRVLLDVVRGLTPRRVVNVDSRIGWELFSAYGRPLSAAISLGAYLFGARSELEDCFAVLDEILLASDALRDEIVHRYALPRSLQARLRVVHDLAGDLAAGIGTPRPRSGEDG